MRGREQNKIKKRDRGEQTKQLNELKQQNSLEQMVANRPFFFSPYFWGNERQKQTQKEKKQYI